MLLVVKTIAVRNLAAVYRYSALLPLKHNHGTSYDLVSYQKSTIIQETREGAEMFAARDFSDSKMLMMMSLKEDVSQLYFVDGSNRQCRSSMMMSLKEDVSQLYFVDEIHMTLAMPRHVVTVTTVVFLSSAISLTKVGLAQYQKVIQYCVKWFISLIPFFVKPGSSSSKAW
ncbi:hypothetical protein DICVIV_08058 [Dictyocaulus viviparus]|uniref:Uncharacterized protein n=1 Tax=Dictyocaulus viviparus TaxID=29172 RepID=A0A0D8XMP9_DICVI|nr:hypothetical protein DICVIV_08058 [Dictyocaulus viviparus]